MLHLIARNPDARFQRFGLQPAWSLRKGLAAAFEDEISAATALTLEGLKLQAEIALQCEHHSDGEERAWAVVRALLTVT